jgi:hypothetical protein
MSVTVYLRQNSPLQWGQVNSNFQNLADAANVTIPQGGTTAARPAVPTLYQTYVDTTLGVPIFCTQVSPPIWINSVGVVV